MASSRLSLALLPFAFASFLHAAADKAPTPDPLGRDTPRSSISQFLEACHAGKYIRAAQYLDLSRIPERQRGTEGADLAQKLSLFLDRDMDFEVGQLDNTPQGRSDDDLAGDLDRLTSVSENGHRISLYLEREYHDGVAAWVLSADSAAHISQLELPGGPPRLEAYMPQPLVQNKLLGTPLWSWFGLVLLGVALALLSRALSRLLVFVARPLARRYTPWVSAYRMAAFIDPLRLLLGVAVFRACMDAFAPSALMREYLNGTLALLAVIGLASILMRIVDVISDHVLSRLTPAGRSLSYSVVPLGARFVKICIFCVAVLVVLDQWDVRLTTILAGVGVGGLAVALAAQKTLENLFGGISILTDRPVLVGDVCQFGGQTGTVTDIGLRSTRLRTNERTVVTVPNAQFSAMTLENFSQRDRMLFKPVLHLRRDTEPEKIRALMSAVESLLRERPDVDATDVPVRFASIEPESFRLEVFSYVVTPEYNQFLRARTDLLLRILELAQSLNVRFAVPFAESIATEMHAN